MIFRHRGMLTLVTLLVLVSVTIGGGLWLTYAKVDPSTASREQIVRYLVLADVAAEPVPVQQAWVNRLQRELTADLTPGYAAGSLSDTYRERLIRNVNVLQAIWFQTRTAEYARLSDQEREAFLLDQLTVVASWAKVATLIDGAPVPPAVATGKLIERIETWIDQASGQQRDEMVAAVKDATVCWLSTSDLSDQPPATKSALALRLARELDRGAQPKVAGLVTDAARRDQLARNAEQLVEAYVFASAAEYASLPSLERPQYVDDQLAAVERWGISNMLATGHSEQTSSTSTVLALVQQSQQWVEHAPEDQRPQVQAFVTAVQKRVVWKQLPSWLRR